jgi:hypothetical protein
MFLEYLKLQVGFGLRHAAHAQRTVSRTHICMAFSTTAAAAPSFWCSEVGPHRVGGTAISALLRQHPPGMHLSNILYIVRHTESNMA